MLKSIYINFYLDISQTINFKFSCRNYCNKIDSFCLKKKRKEMINTSLYCGSIFKVE